MKYQPDYPGRFTGQLHARGWLEPFFGWHNDEHHHSNLALFTPAEVFFGRVDQVRVVRQAALNAAHAAHPERFPNGPPRVLLPPSEVSINPITSTVVVVDPALSPSAEPASTQGPAGSRGAAPRGVQGRSPLASAPTAFCS